MTEKINKLTDTRIEVVKTIEQKKEYEKATLEAMKQTKLDEIAYIDSLLSQFSE